MTVQIEMSHEEFQRQLIKSDAPVTLQQYQWLKSLAKEWGVSVYTIALLGGKPYPTQAALFAMLANKCDREGIVVTGIRTLPLERAEKDKVRAGFETLITLFDKRGYDEAVAKLNGTAMNAEGLVKLRESFTHAYREEGWASPESIRMKTLHNTDYVNHMAATRSIDRTLRIIVRCPFTAASEMPEGTPEGSMDTGAPGQPPATKPETVAPAPSSPPVSRPVPTPVTVAKPDEKVNEKQIAAFMGRWSEYVKQRMSGLNGEQIEAKFKRLAKALYGKDSPKDLTVANLKELLDYLEQGAIEITEDGSSEAAS